MNIEEIIDKEISSLELDKAQFMRKRVFNSNSLKKLPYDQAVNLARILLQIADKYSPVIAEDLINWNQDVLSQGINPKLLSDYFYIIKAIVQKADDPIERLRAVSTFAFNFFNTVLIDEVVAESFSENKDYIAEIFCGPRNLSEIKRLVDFLFKQKPKDMSLLAFILSKNDEDSANYANIFLHEAPTNDIFIELQKIAGANPEIINKFLLLYAGLKKQFPDFENIHDGFKSVVRLDLNNPNTDYYDGEDKEIKTDVARRRYNIPLHLITLERIIEKESTTPEQRVLRFQQPYSPKDQGLVEAEFFGIYGKNLQEQIFELERILKRQKKSRNIKELIKHDQLLLVYFRLKSRETINSVIVGKTISTFLNLDPELKTGRCTAGAGIFRKTTYQYALSRDISIIDLCLNTPNNKVAEVMTVNCKDERGGNVLLIETAEAGDDAFLLPDYKGMPAWTYLLLEEVVDKAYKSQSRIVFSTNLDFKPATNMFVTAAATMLNLVKDIPRIGKYAPRFRDPLEWNELLTRIRWEGNKEARRMYLEKKYPKIRTETKTVRTERNYPRPSHISGRAIMAGVDDLSYNETKTETRRIVEGSIEETGLLPEMYLGAWNSNSNFQLNLVSRALKLFGLYDWVADENNKTNLAKFMRRNLEKPKKPFHYRGHPNINNGKGFVDGFEYLTEKNYQQFKGQMIALREHLGLV